MPKNTRVEYGLGFRQNSVSPSVDTPGITAGGGMKMIRSIAGKVVQPGEVVSSGIPSWRLFLCAGGVLCPGLDKRRVFVEICIFPLISGEQAWPPATHSSLDAGTAFDPETYTPPQVHWSMLIPWPPYFAELAGWLAMLIMFAGLVALKITNSTRYANKLTAFCTTAAATVNLIGAVGYATLGEVGANRATQPRPQTRDMRPHP